MIDALLSPVVEFTGCFFDGQLLRRGRMYYVDGFFAEDGEWEEKAEPFRTWARAVLKRTKKILTRTESDYIGSHAAAWLAEGSGRRLVSM
ncbi:MAG: hypothetical protein H7138_09665 [Myxococcales bacterium]|nr:hypothetical protein [Myxococcales bacterium]